MKTTSHYRASGAEGNASVREHRLPCRCVIWRPSALLQLQTQTEFTRLNPAALKAHGLMSNADVTSVALHAVSFAQTAGHAFHTADVCAACITHMRPPPAAPSCRCRSRPGTPRCPRWRPQSPACCQTCAHTAPPSAGHLHDSNLRVNSLHVYSGTMCSALVMLCMAGLR
jgi:hypothetical protein